MSPQSAIVSLADSSMLLAEVERFWRELAAVLHERTESIRGQMFRARIRPRIARAIVRACKAPAQRKEMIDVLYKSVNMITF